MEVGFTGTQRGMTNAQKATLRSLLNAGSGTLHHGDCIGADAEAHDIATGMGYETEGHPPSNPKKRAYKTTTRTNVPLPYLERNQNIVDETVQLIAAPGEFEEQKRSGTWSTIRYARQTKAPFLIIFPDGTIVNGNKHAS